MIGINGSVAVCPVLDGAVDIISRADDRPSEIQANDLPYYSSEFSREQFFLYFVRDDPIEE